LSPAGAYPYAAIFQQPFVDLDRKFLYTIALLAPLAFTPLLSVRTFFLLTFLPWAEIWLSSLRSMYEIGYQYPYMLIPLLFVASIYGLKSRKPSLKTLRKVCVVMTTIAVLSAPAVVCFTPFPQLTSRTDKLHEIIRTVPEDASISTQNDLFPHVCQRPSAYLGYKPGVDYILIDLKSIQAELTCKLPEEVYEQYDEVVSFDEIYLLKRK
jgi:uncharacterized membrane protein